MRLNEILAEGLNHPVIVVDVQLAYSNGYNDSLLAKIIKFVNKQTGPVLMFVNAEDQGLTDDTIPSIKQYWNDTICPEEERYGYNEETDNYFENPNCPTIDWTRFQIVDKGYGYFRSWMDHGVSEAVIIKVIRAMYQYKISDTRQFEDIDPLLLPNLVGSEWDQWMYYDSIQIYWTSVAQLKKFNGAYIVGGGRNECLREIELLMNAFNIRYKRIDSLVYG
jgi:hypothetical protein